MSEIVWRRADDLPEHNQSCHIRGDADFIRLNVCYKSEVKGWIDLFATPEAGALYTSETGVRAWVPAESIPDPPDSFFEC